MKESISLRALRLGTVIMTTATFWPRTPTGSPLGSHGPPRPSWLL